MSEKMLFSRSILFSMFSIISLSNVHGMLAQYADQTNIINENRKKIHTEYEKLRESYPITKFIWDDKNASKMRTDSIRKNCNVNGDEKTVQAILFIERLYTMYSNPFTNTYELLFNPENIDTISYISYQDDFVKNIIIAIDWIHKRNKDMRYLIQMPFIMSKLLGDIAQIENNEFKKRMCLGISDEMWCDFMFENIKDDYFDVFDIKRYTNCEQYQMDVVTYKIASFCRNLISIIDNCGEYEEEEEEDDDNDTFRIINKEDSENFREALAKSYIYKKKKELLKK